MPISISCVLFKIVIFGTFLHIYFFIILYQTLHFLSSKTVLQAKFFLMVKVPPLKLRNPLSNSHLFLRLHMSNRQFCPVVPTVLLKLRRRGCPFGVPESYPSENTRGIVPLKANQGAEKTEYEEKQLVEQFTYLAPISYGYIKSNAQYLAAASLGKREKFR